MAGLSASRTPTTESTACLRVPPLDPVPEATLLRKIRVGFARRLPREPGDRAQVALLRPEVLHGARLQSPVSPADQDLMAAAHGRGVQDPATLARLAAGVPVQACLLLQGAVFPRR